ncbi:hypothetical protein LIER_12474 [Lithospermum erythrorhizon]|uniref:Uncharacterized protein n=1 Tax=Lithospermum erythrorhizon TaxID=34254 RepID=A0AAV3PTU6_LITER
MFMSSMFIGVVEGFEFRMSLDDLVDIFRVLEFIFLEFLVILIDFDLDFMKIPAFMVFSAYCANFRPASLRLPDWNVKGWGIGTSCDLNGRVIPSGLMRLDPLENAWTTLACLVGS